MRKYDQVYLIPFYEKINNQLIKFKNLRLQIIDYQIIDNELYYFCLHSYVNEKCEIINKVFQVTKNQISKKKWIN